MAISEPIILDAVARHGNAIRQQVTFWAKSPKSFEESAKSEPER